MNCLKCGGTGVQVNRKRCDCGAEKQSQKPLSLQETHIPELYRGDSDKVGKTEIIIGAKEGFGLDSLIEEIAAKAPNYPSLFVDLSECETGAYEVYYAILEKRIQNGEPLKTLKSGLMANKTIEKRFKETIHATGEGIKGYNNYIISDFPINQYIQLEEWVKVHSYSGSRKLSVYPLNMYRIRVVSP